MNRYLSRNLPFLMLWFFLPRCDTGNDVSKTREPLWCGDTLCSWTLETGEAEPTPTVLSGNDLGVAFDSPEETVISQFLSVTAENTECLRVSFIASLGQDAQVFFEIDYYDNHIVDQTLAVPKVDWEPVAFDVELPMSFYGIRMRIRVKGNSHTPLDTRVILANLAVDTNGCSVVTRSSTIIKNRPLGALCVDSSECASGLCAELWSDHYVCSECAVGSNSCSDGHVCGLSSAAPPYLYTFGECGAKKRHAIGERCIGHQECDSEVCYKSVCSQCEGNTPDCRIADDRVHLSPSNGFNIAFHQPYLSRSPIQPGGTCLHDDQCTSGTCVGSGDLKVCGNDGRVCSGEPDCKDLVGGFNFGGWNICTIMGTSRGTCR